MASCSNCNTQIPDDSLFCPSCGTPLGASREDELLASSASDPTGLLDRLREATAGEFTIIRELGRGGMGRVYLAHERALDRRVAMKVLPPALAEHAGIVQRFQREARTAGKLSHPNIVPVYQVSERRGLYFFTMPYVAGPSLRQILSKTPQLDIELVRRYLREGADALSYAHARGVVHRDIKPENMLMEGSRDGRLMLTDFGIAKALGAGTTLTRPGDMMGTPYFMSPEQCEEADHIDGRSDQYSLGLVGWEMLAGRFPFTADSLAGMVYKHLHEYPEPLENVRPDVPADLVATLSRAIRKKPDERFPSMAEFLAALAAGGDRGTVVRPSAAQGPPAGRRRHGRGWIGLAALAVIATLIGTTVWYQGWGPLAGGGPAQPGQAGDESAQPGGAAASLDSAQARADSVAALVGASDTAAEAGSRQAGMSEGEQAGAPSQPTPQEQDQLLIARRQADRARDEAEEARRLAVGMGADSLFPDRFQEIDRQYAAARGVLEGGQIVAAATAFGAVTQAFGDLAAGARDRLAEVTAPGQTNPDSAAGVPAGGGPESGPASEQPPEEAIAALIETYRLALEAEDRSRLEDEVYKGAVPGVEWRFLSHTFDRAEQIRVTIESEGIVVRAATAEANVRQRMDYLLSVTGDRRGMNLSLQMFFERRDGSWRLSRIEGYPEN